MAGNGFLVGEITAKVKADNTQFNKGIDETKQKGQKASVAIGKGFQNVGKSMQKLGKSMTKYVTLPLLAIGAAAFKMGKDFEAEMSKVEGLVGVAGDVVDQWGQDILNMAPELASTPKALAEGMFFVTSAGLRGSEAMDVLEMSAKASAAGLGEVAVIADAVTSVLNAYGSENISASEATDVLTAAVREGKLEASSIAPVLGRLLPMASSLDIAFSQVAGSIAVMSRTGAEATESATSLQSIMMFLQKPTNEARKTLNDAGIAMSDLRDMASKEPDGLVQVMRLLNDTFADDDEAIAKIIPNVRAFRGVMNILAQEGETVDNVIRNVAESVGMTEEAFATASETANFKWNSALSSMQVLFIEIWDVLKSQLIPIIEGFVTKVKDLVDKFKALSDEQRENISKWFMIAVAAGPVLIIIGKIISGVGSLILAAPKIAAAFKIIGTALTSPLGLALAAVAALAGAVWWGIKNIETESEYVQKATAEEIIAINEVKDAKILAAREKYTAVEASLEEELNAVEAAYTEELAVIEKFAKDAKAAEKTRLEEKLSAADKAYDNAIENIRDEYGYVERTTKSKTDVVNDYYDNMQVQAKNAYDAAIEFIDKELKEQLKLLDTETQEQIQAVQDKIDGINDLSEAEEKARKEKKDAETLSSLESAVTAAKTTADKKEAQEELDNWLEEQRIKQLADTRADLIEELNNEISDIRDNASDKADEYKEDAETKKTEAENAYDGSMKWINLQRDEEIEAIQLAREEKEKQEGHKLAAVKSRIELELNQLNNGVGNFSLALALELAEKRDIEDKKYLATKERIDKENALLAAQNTLANETAAAINEANVLAGQAILEAQNDFQTAPVDNSIEENGKIMNGSGAMGFGNAFAEAVGNKIASDMADNGIKIDPTGGAGHFGYQYASPYDYDDKETPEFSGGGTIRGPKGRKLPAFLHDGETVLPEGFSLNDNMGDNSMDKIGEAIYQGFTNIRTDERGGGNLNEVSLVIDGQKFGKIVYSTLTKERERIGEVSV